MNQKTKKECPVCGETNLKNFFKNVSSKDGLQNNCKTCQTNYAKEHYLKNKEYVSHWSVLNKQRRAGLITEATFNKKVKLLKAIYKK